jgi:hypothetical protein
MLGESDRSVADILRDRGATSADDRSDLDEAGEWIVMFLTEVAGTGYAPAVEVIRAGSAAGFPKHTLQRARKRVGIRTTKADFGGGWVWVLPEDDAQGDEGDASRETSSSSPSQSPSVSCGVCGNPLDPALAGIGEVTHPFCDPTGTVGRDPAYVARPDPLDVDLDELFDVQLPIPESAETRP